MFMCWWDSSTITPKFLKSRLNPTYILPSKTSERIRKTTSEIVVKILYKIIINKNNVSSIIIVRRILLHGVFYKPNILRKYTRTARNRYNFTTFHYQISRYEWRRHSPGSNIRNQPFMHLQQIVYIIVIINISNQRNSFSTSCIAVCINISFQPSIFNKSYTSLSLPPEMLYLFNQLLINARSSCTSYVGI